MVIFLAVLCKSMRLTKMTVLQWDQITMFAESSDMVTTSSLVTHRQELSGELCSILTCCHRCYIPLAFGFLIFSKSKRMSNQFPYIFPFTTWFTMRYSSFFLAALVTDRGVSNRQLFIRIQSWEFTMALTMLIF